MKKRNVLFEHNTWPIDNEKYLWLAAFDQEMMDMGQKLIDFIEKYPDNKKGLKELQERYFRFSQLNRVYTNFVLEWEMYKTLYKRAKIEIEELKKENEIMKQTLLNL